MLRHIGFGAVLLGMVALVACAGGGAPAGKPAAGGATTIKTLDTMRFDPNTITARANQQVSLTLDNSGQALVHDFTIDNLGGSRVHVEVQPNQRASVQFTPTAPGTYQFYCSQPGHREAGMVGTLTVS
ncbi:MAG TPA: cupredoxin domain-containing protein [Chloroflexota bacterium]|nr:cupredoxin domain-containing protein [Chloroflexota bacterium]HZU08224.1 cupredoxin domain-containing protein [Chloroflexota bacterium]